MRRFAAFLVAPFALATASAAYGAVTVFGTSPARSCYEAARSPARSSSGIAICDEAFSTEALSRDEKVATHVNRGILRATKGDVAGALGDYDAALALDAKQPEAWLNKGFAYLRRDDARGALPFFDAAVANGTSEPAMAFYGRGIAHELAGNVRAAYTDFLQARKLQPRWQLPQEELSRFKVGRAAR